MMLHRRRAAAVAAVVMATVVLLVAASAAATFLVPVGIEALDDALLLFPGASAVAVALVAVVAVARPEGRRWPPAVAGVGFLTLLVGAYGGGARCLAAGSGTGLDATFVSCGEAVGNLPLVSPCLAIIDANCVMLLGIGTIVVGGLLLGTGLWHTERFDAALARLERHVRTTEHPDR